MSKFNFFDIEQNSEEWFKLRAGKLTMSKLSVVMANYGKPFGDPAKKYAVNIAIEQITGKPIPGSYSNEHMERGHEQEPIARGLYELETFSEVSNGGFFSNDFIGCSPDGLVGDSGQIEIKSVIASTHFETVKRCSFDPAYKWQLAGSLKYTGRDWIDFVSFCDEFPEGKKLFIFRVRKEDFKDEFDMIDDRVSQFMGLIEERKNIILESKYFNQ